MDLATLIGFLMGGFMLVFGIAQGDGGISLITENFIDKASIIITVGGSLAGVIACHKIPDIITSLKAMVLAFKEQKADAGEAISNIITLSNTARKEGLLALEEAANSIEDEFLKKGIMLVVDGTDPELVRGILETDLSCIEARHKKVIGFYEKWAELGPAWGMLGTLIGLVNMLKDMSDIASVGPNMAVALLTTFYGSMIANWLCNPTATKLKVNNDMEMMIKEITVEGLLSIQAGENPRIIEEKLKSFLAPKVREAMAGKEGGEA